MAIKLPPRICLAFAIVLTLSVLIILIAWNMTSSMDLDPDSNSVIHAYPTNETVYEHAGGGRVLVDIYYEVLCPDSRHFIVNQFLPVYKDLEELMDVNFIPYGKASSNKITTFPFFSFQCQHGERECQGNMIHGCAIHDTKIKAHTLVHYISCMMQTRGAERQELGAEKCASKFKSVNFNDIQECYKDGRGHKYLYQFGVMTSNLKPTVSFIPTIVINKSQGGQKDILRDFRGFVCRILMKHHETAPKGC